MHKTFEVRKVEALERIAASLEQIANPAVVTQQIEPLQLGTDYVDPNELLTLLNTPGQQIDWPPTPAENARYITRRDSPID